MEAEVKEEEVEQIEINEVVQQLALLGILQSKQEDGEESFSLCPCPDLEIVSEDGKPLSICWDQVPPIGPENFESKFSYVFSYFAGLIGDEELEELGQTDAWEAGQQDSLTGATAPWLIAK
jgi:hypothetical protein